MHPKKLLSDLENSNKLPVEKLNHLSKASFENASAAEMKQFFVFAERVYKSVGFKKKFFTDDKINCKQAMLILYQAALVRAQNLNDKAAAHDFEKKIKKYSKHKSAKSKLLSVQDSFITMKGNMSEKSPFVDPSTNMVRFNRSRTLNPPSDNQFLTKPERTGIFFSDLKVTPLGTGIAKKNLFKPAPKQRQHRDAASQEAEHPKKRK